MALPVTYALHLVDEYVSGDGFWEWAERTLALTIGRGEFVAWNAFGFVLMCLGAALAASQKRLRWIEIAMGISVLGNVAAHVAASVLTRTYSPGLISGVVIWAPVALWRIGAAVRMASRRGPDRRCCRWSRRRPHELGRAGWTAL